MPARDRAAARTARPRARDERQHRFVPYHVGPVHVKRRCSRLRLPGPKGRAMDLFPRGQNGARHGRQRRHRLSPAPGFWCSRGCTWRSPLATPAGWPTRPPHFTRRAASMERAPRACWQSPPTSAWRRTSNARRAKRSAAFGQLDILINSAGSAMGGSFVDLPDQAFLDAWTLKLLGYIRMTRAVVPAMIARRDGRIVNIVGGAGRTPSAGFLPGSTANAALLNFTRGLAKDLSAHNVRINAISPGLTATERAERWPPPTPSAARRLDDVLAERSGADSAAPHDASRRDRGDGRAARLGPHGLDDRRRGGGRRRRDARRLVPAGRFQFRLISWGPRAP